METLFKLIKLCFNNASIQCVQVLGKCLGALCAVTGILVLSLPVRCHFLRLAPLKDSLNVPRGSPALLDHCQRDTIDLFPAPAARVHVISTAISSVSVAAVAISLSSHLLLGGQSPLLLRFPSLSVHSFIFAALSHLSLSLCRAWHAFL